MIGKLVLIAVFLNLQIAFGMFDLLGDWNQLMPLTDADAEQPRQRVDHLYCVGVAPLLAHPRNRVQRVVQEVRIDLCLQRFQLGFAQIDLFLAHRGHQLLDAPHHMLKRAG